MRQVVEEQAEQPRIGAKVERKHGWIGSESSSSSRLHGFVSGQLAGSMRAKMRVLAARPPLPT